MRIGIVGTGYVGLVSGACLAEAGHDVHCVDAQAAKVDALKQGQIPIYEPGLDEMVARNAAAGRLRFTTDLDSTVAATDVVFLCVGTPSRPDGSCDMTYVHAALDQVAGAMNAPKVVVMKSTVPVGTAAETRARLEAGARFPAFVVSNPEVLREGSAVGDFMTPDRVVVGAREQEAIDTMREIYAPFVSDERPLLVMDNVSAELTKYAANSLLATRISFMNEMSNLADATGGDVELVRAGIGFDARIGHSFLRAGVGFGGSCFPKDVRSLVDTAAKHQVELRVARASVAANVAQKRRMFAKVEAALGSLEGRHVALWGFAFKPETDDIREAPAEVFVRQAVEAGATVTICDPVARENAERLFGEVEGVRFADDPQQTVEGADALCLFTEWAQFRQPDWEQVAARMRGRWVFDGRNLFQARRVAAAGFRYEGFGRPVAEPEPTRQRRKSA